MWPIGITFRSCHKLQLMSPKASLRQIGGHAHFRFGRWMAGKFKGAICTVFSLEGAKVYRLHQLPIGAHTKPNPGIPSSSFFNLGCVKFLGTNNKIVKQTLKLFPAQNIGSRRYEMIRPNPLGGPIDTRYITTSREIDDTRRPVRIVEVDSHPVGWYVVGNIDALPGGVGHYSIVHGRQYAARVIET